MPAWSNVEYWYAPEILNHAITIVGFCSQHKEQYLQ